MVTRMSLVFGHRSGSVLRLTGNELPGLWLGSLAWRRLHAAHRRANFKCQLKVVAKMVQAGSCDSRVVLRLGEHKGALHDGLHEKRKAVRDPGRVGCMERFGRCDIGPESRSVPPDVPTARLADVWICPERFLRHHAEQARERRQISLHGPPCARGPVSDNSRNLLRGRGLPGAAASRDRHSFREVMKQPRKSRSGKSGGKFGDVRGFEVISLEIK
jgi:hypothetical protein